MDNILINLDDGIRLTPDTLPNVITQSDIISQSDTLVGPPGPPGPAGPAGRDGAAATITVGSTTTGAAGTNATVTNSGTSSAAVLEFVIPRGNTGETGPAGPTGPAGQDGADGAAATITVGSVQTVDPEYPATVQNSGTSSAAVLDFTIPRGNTGETGPAGQDGADGQAATITVGSTTTGAAGTNATVTNSGTTSAAVLDFVIPRGETGATGATGPAGQDGQDGADGQAATITVGSTTTGAAGTNASVTNSGTTSAAVLEFTIPRGDTGATGATGATGPAGQDGSDGFSPTATVTQNTGSATISITDKNGTTTATVYDGVTPDTSVTSYSLSSTPAHSGGVNSYSIKKQLNMVTMNVQNLWTNAVTTSWVTIGTIVSDIRPSENISCAGIVIEGNNGSVVTYGKVQVQSDGNVRFRANAAYNGLTAYGFSITWLI